MTTITVKNSHHLKKKAFKDDKELYEYLQQKMKSQEVEELKRFFDHYAVDVSQVKYTRDELYNR